MDKKQSKDKLVNFIKRTEILFLALILVPFFYGSKEVKGEYVVAGVKSHISLYYGKEFFEFDTYKTELEDAIEEQGIKIYDQDVFSIPRDTRLYGQSIEVNVIKSLPVVINDNGEHIIGRTVYSKPEKILEQNNIKYWPEDKLSIELITDPLSVKAIGQIVNIERAPVYKVHVDGKIKEVHSWGENVKEIIDGKISLGPKDIITPSFEDFPEEGNIYITRVEIAETEIIVPIPYHQVVRYDYYSPQGATLKIADGVEGAKKQKLKIRYENGKEISRIVLSEEIIKEPKSQIIKKGLMPSNHPDFEQSYWNWMVSAGQKYSISPLDLYNVAVCESHVNPYSINPAGYYGMYQYSLGFWSSASAEAGFSGASWDNAKAQIYTTAYYASKNGWGRWGCKP